MRTNNDLPRAISSTVPDDETWGAMKRREQELQRSKLSQRALKLTCCDAPAIMHQLRLQVVREFGLPDSTVEILQSDSLAQVASLQHSTTDSRTRYRLSTSCCASHKQYIPDNGDTHRRRKHSSPSTPVSPDHSYGTAEVSPLHHEMCCYGFCYLFVCMYISVPLG